MNQHTVLPWAFSPSPLPASRPSSSPPPLRMRRTSHPPQPQQQQQRHAMQTPHIAIHRHGHRRRNINVIPCHSSSPSSLPNPSPSCLSSLFSSLSTVSSRPMLLLRLLCLLSVLLLALPCRAQPPRTSCAWRAGCTRTCSAPALFSWCQYSVCVCVRCQPLLAPAGPSTGQTMDMLRWDSTCP